MCSADPKTALRFLCLFICLSVRWSVCPLLSCTVLPCIFTSGNVMAAMQFVHYTGVATVSSLAQLRVQHVKEQGQCKHEADQVGRSKKITCDTYRAAN